MPQESRTAKLVGDLAERIRNRIASGEFPPGGRLRQEVLAKEFDVSRTPIREALRQLEAKGVISQAHRRSAVVLAPSSRDVRETYQIRAELEGLAAQLAAPWISDTQLRLMHETHQSFSVAVEELARQSIDATAQEGEARITKRLSAAAEAWITTNAAFHRVIHEASDNHRLSVVINNLNLGQISSIMLSTILGMDAHRLRLNLTHHERILAELERRDAKGAREAVMQHILEAGEFVVRWLERINPADVVSTKDRGGGKVRPGARRPPSNPVKA